MNSRTILIPAMASLTVAGVIAGVQVIARDDAKTVAAPRGTSSAIQPSAGMAAAVPDQSCDLGAVPDLSAADSRMKDAAADNPASQAKPDRIVMTREAAIERARQAFSLTATDASAAKSLPAAAAQVSYAQANRWLGGSDSDLDKALVAANRCVWAVTVEGPFTPRSQPLGKKVPTHDVFTSFFDSNSGQYLGLTTDKNDLPNVISGANLGLHH